MGQPLPRHGGRSHPECIGMRKGTRGTETSQYPEEETSTEMPQVVASERGAAQTSPGRPGRGVVGPAQRSTRPEGNGLERPSRAGETPVPGPVAAPGCVPEYHGTREILWETGGTTLQGYLPVTTDSG